MSDFVYYISFHLSAAFDSHGRIVRVLRGAPSRICFFFNYGECAFGPGVGEVGSVGLRPKSNYSLDGQLLVIFLFYIY